MNLLAANRNCPSEGSSGSGIYAGRFGALRTFISEEARDGILVADVPIDLEHGGNGKDEPEDANEFRSENRRIKSTNSELNLMQEDLREFDVEFLKVNASANRFSKSMWNGNVYCHFTIVIDDQGERVGEV